MKKQLNNLSQRADKNSKHINKHTIEVQPKRIDIGLMYKVSLKYLQAESHQIADYSKKTSKRNKYPKKWVKRTKGDKV